MLAAPRRTVGTVLATLRLLAVARDPILLMGRTGRWRWPWVVGGLLLTAFVFWFLNLAAAAFEDAALRSGWTTASVMQSVFPIDPAQPVTYVHLVLASLPFLVAPLIALAVAHRLSWRHAFSYGVGFQWRQFSRAALALLTLAVASAVTGYVLEPEQHRFPPHAASYPFWAFLALAVVFVQSLGEEVLFRGYLLRVVGAVLPFRLPVTAGVIAIFVAGHVGNDDVRRDLLFNVVYFVIFESISYALLFRTQNLAASAGLHWMNNVIALFAPTVPGQPVELALLIYTDPVYAGGGSRLFDLMTHGGALLAAVLLLVLLLWPRSPFYIEKTPLPASDAPSDPTDAGSILLAGAEAPRR